ncbi:MAG: polyprenyl synthetase family protein [Catenulispora sp.]|nr:polyprenyl synthetase family protein [Catenulispora sp.]
MTIAATPAPPLPPDLAAFPAQVASRMRDLARGLAASVRGPVLGLVDRPGKALRALLIAACAAPGRADRRTLVRLGAIVELIHLASLLHDDVVDKAPSRRGAPAAHTVVGPELAALAGLSCFALAGMEAASVGGGVQVLASQASAGLSYGQVLDVERAFDTDLSVDDYVELAARKTGDLFRLSCLLGAAAGQADPETGRRLGEFGLHFGIAFQVLDDCLDFQDGGTGKPFGLDQLRGMFGAPTLYALRSDRQKGLAELLLSPGFTVADMPTVKKLVTESGGLRAAQELAGQHRMRALEALDAVRDAELRQRVLAVVAAHGWVS